MVINLKGKETEQWKVLEEINQELWLPLM